MKGNIRVHAPASVKNLHKILESAIYVHKWCIKNHSKYKAGSNLAGMCAVASIKLLEELRKNGVPKVKIEASENHMAVVIASHLLVDVTICQFDPDTAVYIGGWDKKSLPTGYFKPGEIFSSRKAATTWMKHVGWAASQIPTG